MGILLRIGVYAVAIAITAAILPGITVVRNDIGTYIIIAIVFGLLNGILKPILQVLTCPLVLLTLGLFLLVINGLMLWITASLVPDRLQIDGFGWAILGGILMSLVGVVLENVLGLRDNRR
jgi:putative membrane protein